jgi:hypothetical protein
MSIASTLLLLNDDPRKPLNQHFDDSLVDLKNWISNAIQYIATDDVIKNFKRTGSFSPITLKHKGAIKIKTGAMHTSGTINAISVYLNEKKVATLGASDTTVINIEAGDVLRAEKTSSGLTPEYIQICGFPTILDF